MEYIITNPGLQHIAENIFWNLDIEDLRICGYVNESCQQLCIEQSKFWLRKFVNLSKDNKEKWNNIIQSMNNLDKGIAIIYYLRLNLKKRSMLDLPCYTSPAVQNDIRKRIWESCAKFGISSDKDIKMIKIMAHLAVNPNAPNVIGETPIYWAASRGHTEIVKILAPLTDNPNAPDEDGFTPIYWAAQNGYTDILKILAPLTDNPNAPNKDRRTEIVKILAPLIDNLDEDGFTSIEDIDFFHFVLLTK